MSTTITPDGQCSGGGGLCGTLAPMNEHAEPNTTTIPSAARIDASITRARWARTPSVAGCRAANIELGVDDTGAQLDLA